MTVEALRGSARVSVAGRPGQRDDEVRSTTGPGLGVSPTVSLVVPALNEEENVAWVLRQLPSLIDEVILVDGRSTDDTIAVARRERPDIRVVLETRPGKGVALRAGFAAARGDYIAMIDADGSMDPGELARFTAELNTGAELVKGSRFVLGGGTCDMSGIRKLGNACLLAAGNGLYRTTFTDLCYGFMAFRRDRLDALQLTSDGFEIETEIVVRAVVAGLTIAEVPSFESQRLHGESNLHAWRDGRRVLATLVRERFARRRPLRTTRPSVAT